MCHLKQGILTTRAINWQGRGGQLHRPQKSKATFFLQHTRELRIIALIQGYTHKKTFCSIHEREVKLWRNIDCDHWSASTTGSSNLINFSLFVSQSQVTAHPARQQHNPASLPMQWHTCWVPIRRRRTHPVAAAVRGDTALCLGGALAPGKKKHIYY